MISINNNDKLFNGFFTVCEAVSQTMGAQGKLAVIENKILGKPIITKDGISTAKEIFFKDNFENLGAHLAKQVAAKTLVTAGDSTTTSLVFAKSLVKNSARRKYFGLFGKKQYFFNKRVEQGMDMAYEHVCGYLKILSRPVNDDIIKSIASVSANNNSEIGDLVFKAYSAVGKNGIIDVDISDKAISYTDVSKGMKLNKGWENPFLINNQKNAKFEGTNALVVLYEGFLGGDRMVESFLQNVINSDSERPVVLIAEGFKEDTLIKLVDLHQRGILNITAVQAPDYSNKRKAILEDIACFTGGKVFLQGGKQDSITAGVADKIIVSESRCEIIKNELSEEVLERIDSLKNQENEVNDKEFIRKRIQALEGVSATIYVGGVEELERKERFDRVEDAVCSIKSAQEEGWIAGGGSGLAYLSDNLSNKYAGTAEIAFGYKLVMKALEEPLKQICRNSRRNYDTYLRIAKKTYGKGYNAYSDRQSNLIEDNIIDSTKSLRTALENALSVTKLLLNTGIIITLNQE